MDTYFYYLSMITSVIFVVIYIFIYIQYRDKSVGLWCLGGFFLVGEFMLDNSYMTIGLTGMPQSVQFLNWTFMSIGNILFLWGMYSLIDKPFPVRWIFACIGAVIIKIINIYFYTSILLIIVANTFQGLGFIGAGILLMNQSRLSGLFKYTTIGTLFLLGYFYIDFYYRWFTPLGYLLVTIISDCNAIGFLMLVFQKRIRQGKDQLNLMQYTAHDIKAPMMVIRTYAQGIINGIFPKGSLEGSIQVINNEVDRMDKRVRDMLYYTKLDYLNTFDLDGKACFSLTKLVIDSAERFHLRKPELHWKISAAPIQIKGDREQWNVILDNILENQMRYAKNRIKISLNMTGESGTAILRIWNDGPEIERTIIDKQFKEYQTGTGGEFGLGMMIIKKIIDYHHAKIRVENEDGGVAYYIEVAGQMEK